MSATAGGTATSAPLLTVTAAIAATRATLLDIGCIFTSSVYERGEPHPGLSPGAVTIGDVPSHQGLVMVWLALAPARPYWPPSVIESPGEAREPHPAPVAVSTTRLLPLTLSRSVLFV